MRLVEAVVEQNIRKKGKSECFAWDFFKRYLAKNDGEDQVLDVFALPVNEGAGACRSSSD